MVFRQRQKTQAGFTFVELIIVTAIMVLVFGAILVSFQYALDLASNTRVKLSALSLANDRMEFFRSLSYDDVGLVASFPPGAIPQNSTFVLNGFTIEEQIWVDYEDDPADGEDGTGTPDSNFIPQDYKLIKAEYTWTFNGSTNSLSLSSNIVPRSIETDVGGGTVRINVLDADSSLLPDATVRVTGSSSTFPYNVVRPTTAAGAALFSVPADNGYEVEVSAVIGGNQYSTSSTYVATASNPSPTVAPFTVIEGGISTLTFQIGELSDMTITAKTNIVEDSYEEEFSGTGGIATSTDTAVTGGSLVLEDSFGTYESSGVAYLDTIAPVTIDSWRTVRVAADVPVDTTYRVQFFTGVPGAYTLIPDAELPGNAVGFTDTIIDIETLDSFLYPTTTVGISLETTDAAVTPEITELEVFWRESESALSSADLFVRGDKVIGADASSTPIYKTTATVTTDGVGEVSFTDIEFDNYTVEPLGAYSLATACPAHPFAQEAGVDGEFELIYTSFATNNLRINVVDGLGRSIPGADVQVERGSYDVTQQTNSCGQTYFSGGGLTDQPDYDLTISSPGYATEIISPFEISGETVTTVTLLP